MATRHAGVDAGGEALLRRFGLPANWVPATPADLEAFETRCIDLIRDPANKSGIKEVYPCLGEKPWQAKVYVGPGKQHPSHNGRR